MGSERRGGSTLRTIRPRSRHVKWKKRRVRKHGRKMANEKDGSLSRAKKGVTRVKHEQGSICTHAHSHRHQEDTADHFRKNEKQMQKKGF